MHNILKSLPELNYMNLLRRLRFPTFTRFQSAKLFALTFLTTGYLYKQANLKIQMSEVSAKESSLNLSKYVQYSLAEYNKLQEKNDIILVVDPDRYQEEFAEEIFSLLTHLQRSRQNQKRKLVIMVVKQPLNTKLQEEFQQNFHIKIEYDTILILKNKHITLPYVFGAHDYFENKMLLVKYFEKPIKLNAKTKESLGKALPTLPKQETCILVYADKKSKQYKNILTRFNIIKQYEQFANNQNLHWILFDEEGAAALNLKDIKDGQVFLLQRSSLLNDNRSNLVLENKKLNLYEAGSLSSANVESLMSSLSVAYQKNNIFSAKSFVKEKAKYAVVLEIDLNAVPKGQVKRIVEAFSQLKKQIENSELGAKTELLYFNRKPKQGKLGYQVYVRDDELYEEKLKQHSEKDIETMKTFKSFSHFGEAHSYIYRLDESLPVNKETVMALLQAIQDGLAEEWFMSQDPPKYRKFSQKLVGQTFKSKVLESENDFAVFQYSKNCHACGEYGKYYENLALEALRTQSKLEFGRMNNDHNKADVIQDFPFTPVFMLCKKGIKAKPYVYRNQKFTPSLLRNFFEITTSFELVPEEQFQKVQERFMEFKAVQI